MPWIVPVFAAVVLGLNAGSVHANDPAAASILRANHAELLGELTSNQFGKPLAMRSKESSEGVAGDIYAVMDHPFATTAAALSRPGNWCEILILHINTKYCRPAAGGSILNVSVGKKTEQALDQAYAVAFSYRVAAQSETYLQVRLEAEKGPMGTRDYRIAFEAIPMDDGRTFIHLAYAYGVGAMGQLAMQAYLGTAGSDKVGFTIAPATRGRSPQHIGGMRGVVERNTMRYYLAVESFLGAMATPPQAQLEKRLQDWFAGTERYARQLHEMERGEYLAMKRREHQRQQQAAPGMAALR